MKWHHYLAIATPYILAGVLGVASLASKSNDMRVAAVGVLLVGILSHRNLLAQPPEKQDAPKP